MQPTLDISEAAGRLCSGAVTVSDTNDDHANAWGVSS